ncbi:hypothetical protein NEOKW01_0519 [Nematocida sp. AWRm80]|nr:hypothetical protein NEOKW01_0519 [Nematocida sp. AWRm80]
MEKSEKNTIELTQALKELVKIINTAKDQKNNQKLLERYLIAQKSKLVYLGRQIATYTGIPPTSTAANQFGLYVASTIISNTSTRTEFLLDALKTKVPRQVLKEQILRFITDFSKYLEKDKEEILDIAHKQLLVLQQLKESDKAAKDDPEWLSRIQKLENKINLLTKHISPGLRNSQEKREEDKEKEQRVQRSKEKRKQKQAKSKKDKEDKEEFISVLGDIADLKCFCNFKSRKRVSKQTLLREITIHMLETSSLCYLSVFPTLCLVDTKLSINQCIPNRTDPNLIMVSELYLVHVLEALVRLTGESKEESSICISEYRKTGSFSKDLLQKAIIAHSPDVSKAILAVMILPMNESFYIHLIKILYIVIHKCVSKRIVSLEKTLLRNLPDLLLNTSRSYNISLLRRHNAKNRKTNNQNGNLEELEGSTRDIKIRPIAFDDLLNKRVSYDWYTLVNLVSSGIFNEESLLFRYFSKYHSFRHLVLNSLLRILVRKISGSVYKDILSKQNGNKTNMNNQVVSDRSRVEDRVIPEELTRIVRRRILYLLHMKTIQILKTSRILQIPEVLNEIDSNEFDKLGLPEHPSELIAFLSLALPLFIYSVYSLR